MIESDQFSIPFANIRRVSQRAPGPVRSVCVVTAVLFLFTVGIAQAQVQTFFVTTAEDSGPGSLREVVMQANQAPNLGGFPDQIQFAIPGPGPHNIRLNTPLPPITDAVFINGFSQPNSIPDTNGQGKPFNGVLQIVIDGTQVSVGNGLTIVTGGSDIRGLVIHNFPEAGIALMGPESVNNFIFSNFIGTDVSGTKANGNGRVLDSNIGGVRIEGGAFSNFVERNVISGNLHHGVSIENGARNNSIFDNAIGTDPTGGFAIPNVQNGVRLVSDAFNNAIEGNLISGNGLHGVESSGGTAANFYNDNNIGTNLDGTSAIPNGFYGMNMFGDVGELISNNLISGNASSGIVSGSPGLVITDNLICTNEALTGTIPNNGDGMVLTGGGELIEGNVIAGCATVGVHLRGNGFVTIRSNTIGTDPGRSLAAGNGSHGIWIDAGIQQNIIVETNVIANNAGSGARIQGNNILGVNLTQNLIFNNTEIGIDLVFDNEQGTIFSESITPNDPGDQDNGPNFFQNYPEILNASIDAGDVLVVDYLVDSSPGSSSYPIQVEFFEADLSGFGGIKYLDVSAYDENNAGGQAQFLLPNATNRGINQTSRIVAIATDATGSSSEFSAAAEIGSGQVSIERTILEELFMSTAGANWTNNQNWMTEAPLNSWYGVTEANGVVTRLELEANNLVGTIPANLGALSDLNFLALEQNQLLGGIPLQLGNLTNLTNLDLRSNLLNGTIPSQLGNLINVDFFAISDNQLSGSIPTELGNLASASVLKLGENPLGGPIPSELGNLTGLVELELFSTNVSGPIPTTFGNLTNLVFLDLHDNQLFGAVPASFANLNALQMLDLSENQFIVLPDLSGLSSLNAPNFSFNELGFEDLESNAGIPGVIYSPQAMFGLESTVAVSEGDPITLSFLVPGSANQYRWFRDGSPVLGATTNPFTIGSAALSDAGLYTLEVTSSLVPGLTLESAEILVTVDAVNVEIDVTEPSEVAASSGSSIPLSATLPDTYQPETRELCYRRGAEPGFQCVALAQIGGLNSAQIPQDIVTERGVDYYFRFTLGTEVTNVPSGGANAPFHLQVGVNGLAAPGLFQPRVYRMISVPLLLNNSQITAVLDEYGPYNPAQWRLFRWDPGTQELLEHPNLNVAFTPCVAFWLITANGAGFETPSGTSIDPNTQCGVASMILKPGWNQFGIPRAFPVDWADVQTIGEVEAPVSFTPGPSTSDPYTYDVQTLEPWEGYWVNNAGTQDAVLLFPSIESTAKLGKQKAVPSSIAGAEYAIQIIASSADGQLVDRQNYAAIQSGALSGRDGYDFSEAPGIGRHIRLSMVADRERLAGDFKPRTTEGIAWSFEISSSDWTEFTGPENGIRVELAELTPRPSGHELFVMDEDFNRRIRTVDQAFAINLSETHPVRRFTLIVGSSDFAADLTDDAAVLPQSFLLEQNYPNPFNPSTTIRYQLNEPMYVSVNIYTAIGQHIRTLLDAHLEPGWYEVEWDGRDHTGTDATSGIYFYRISANDFSTTKSMVLVR